MGGGGGVIAPDGDRSGPDNKWTSGEGINNLLTLNYYAYRVNK